MSIPIHARTRADATALFSAAAALPAGDGYALAYGSHATTPGRGSDLDLLFTGLHPLPLPQLERLIAKVKQLHADHHLALDEEVAYETKLYATHAEIEAAAALDGFAGATDYHPPDTAVLLNTPRFRLRLALNALTTPHIFLTGDVAAYRRHLVAAERGCAQLALRLADAEKLALHEAVNALTWSSQGKTYKQFLGYQPHSPHLEGVVRRGLADLEADGQIRLEHNTIHRSPL